MILGSSGKTILGPLVPESGEEQIHRVQGFVVKPDTIKLGWSIYVCSGGSRGGAPLILGKKEEITDGKMAGRASKSILQSSPPPHPP